MTDRDLAIAAYVDGELDPAARDRFEAELAADPGLAQAVAAQQRLRARLSAAYDPILAEPAPLPLVLAAQAANDRPARRLRLPQWGAVAAGLVIGVLAGRLALPPPQGPVVAEDGALVAAGPLTQALDRRLAAEAAPIRVGLSFRAGDGRYCRTFQSAPDRLAGLACRTDDGWQVRTVTAWAPAAETDYRTAGAETPPEILAAVDALIAGEPLDQAQERAAREAGWRR